MNVLLVTLAAVLAMNPFEKNDPLIDDGTSLYEKGQFEAALEKFNEAEKQHAQDPRASYNRGLALHKLGKNDEAKQALQHALDLDRDGSLASKIHYNLGNVAVAAQDKKLALREYREALKKNPSDELARHNYEVVLKDLPPEQPKADAGTPDGGASDAGRPDGGHDGGTDGGADAGSKPDGGQDGGHDGGADGGSPDAGQGDGGNDGGADGGNQGDGGQGDGGRGDGGDGNADKKSDGGEKSDDNKPGDGGADAGEEPQDAGAPQPSEGKLLPDGGVDVSKQDAEKLLDSMKSTEKNMQLWRFRQKSSKSTPNGKDW